MNILGLSSFGFHKQGLPEALFIQKLIHNDRKPAYSPLKSSLIYVIPR